MGGIHAPIHPSITVCGRLAWTAQLLQSVNVSRRTDGGKGGGGAEGAWPGWATGGYKGRLGGLEPTHVYSSMTWCFGVNVV